MPKSIIPENQVLTHLQPIFPTRGCNNRQWANYNKVNASDLSKYEYIQFTKSDSTMAYVMVLDFDIHNALEVMATLPVHPDWIIKGGERPGREGYAQCGWFIQPVNKNSMRAHKKIIASVYGADKFDNDSYLRNPFFTKDTITIYNETPHKIEDIVTEEVKKKAWVLDESNKAYTEYEHTAVRAHGEHIDFSEKLKSTTNGARDTTLWKAVRQQVMLNKIEDKETAMDVAHSLNNLLAEPLSDSTVEKKVDSVFKGKDGFATTQSKRGKKAAAFRTFKSNQLNEMRIKKHDEEGKTWKQIAEEEGKNQEAVERSVIRYRKRLAEGMTPTIDEEIDPETGEVLNTVFDIPDTNHLTSPISNDGSRQVSPEPSELKTNPTQPETPEISPKPSDRSVQAPEATPETPKVKKYKIKKSTKKATTPAKVESKPVEKTAKPDTTGWIFTDYKKWYVDTHGYDAWSILYGNAQTNLENLKTLFKEYYA